MPKHLASQIYEGVSNLLNNVINNRNELRKYVSNHEWCKHLPDPAVVIDQSPVLSLNGAGTTVKVRSATWPSIFAVLTQDALKLIALEFGTPCTSADRDGSGHIEETSWVTHVTRPLLDPKNYGLRDATSKTGYAVGVHYSFKVEICWESIRDWNDARDLNDPVAGFGFEAGDKPSQNSSGAKVYTFDQGMKQLLNDMFKKSTGVDTDVENLINDFTSEVRALNEDKVIIENESNDWNMKYGQLFIENEHLAQVNLDRDNAIKSLEQKLNDAVRPTATTGSGEDRPDGKIEWTPAWRIFGNQKVIDMVEQGSNPPSFFNFDIPVFDYGTETHCDVPEEDPDYEFDKSVLSPILWGLANNKTVYLTGDTGTGKTTHIEQIAAKVKWPTLRVNMDSEMSRMDFIGRDTLIQENGTTVSRFIEGILPQAMKQGVILIADEVDFGRSDIMYAFQSVLENGGSLRLTEDGGRIIKPHPMFRIVATANTKGQGDETGCYQGARVQSQAFLDRFQVWVTQDYLPADKEARIVKAKVPSIGEKPLTQLVKIAGEIRKAFRNGEVLTTVSPRGLESCASYFTALGGTPDNLKTAIKHCIAGRCTDVDAMKVEEFVKAHVI